MSKGHVESGEIINLDTLKDGMSEHSTFALVKTKDMEVIRMVLPRGRDVMEHSVEGEISVQCLKGNVIFQVGDDAIELSENDWFYLKGGESYAFHAKKETVLLVTILFSS